MIDFGEGPVAGFFDEAILCAVGVEAGVGDLHHGDLARGVDGEVEFDGTAQVRVVSEFGGVALEEFLLALVDGLLDLMPGELSRRPRIGGAGRGSEVDHVQVEAFLNICASGAFVGRGKFSFGRFFLGRGSLPRQCVDDASRCLDALNAGGEPLKVDAVDEKKCGAKGQNPGETEAGEENAFGDGTFFLSHGEAPRKRG